MKINIFYGPKKEFENIIPSEMMSLHEFVLKYDTKRNTVNLKNDDESDFYETTDKENIECSYIL